MEYFYVGGYSIVSVLVSLFIWMRASRGFALPLTFASVWLFGTIGSLMYVLFRGGPEFVVHLALSIVFFLVNTYWTAYAFNHREVVVEEGQVERAEEPPVSKAKESNAPVAQPKAESKLRTRKPRIKKVAEDAEKPKRRRRKSDSADVAL